MFHPVSIIRFMLLTKNKRYLPTLQQSPFEKYFSIIVSVNASNTITEHLSRQTFTG